MRWDTTTTTSDHGVAGIVTPERPGTLCVLMWTGVCGVERKTVFIVTWTRARLLEIIRLPERASNLCFGGAERNQLMITASTSVYLCAVNAVGA